MCMPGGVDHDKQYIATVLCVSDVTWVMILWLLLDVLPTRASPENWQYILVLGQ